MRRCTILVLIFLVGFIFVCYAQKNNEPFPPSLSLRTNIFSAVEVDAGVMLGVKYQWHKQFAAVLDPTFIFFNPYRNTNTNDNGSPLGIKIRSDVRYYLDKYRQGHDRFFIAPELHLKYITTKKWTEFGINCIGQQCNYYMYARYREIKNEAGASLKIGTEVYLDRKNLWSLEIYGGLGFKVYHFRQKDIPVGGMFLSDPNQDNIFGTREGTGVPILPGSFKISYRIF